MKVLKQLFFLKTTLWIVLTIFYVYKYVISGVPAVFTIIIAVLLLVNAGLYWLFGIFSNKKHWLYLLLASLFVLANIFLTVTDQFGIYDLIALALDGLILWCLMKNGGYYM